MAITNNDTKRNGYECFDFYGGFTYMCPFLYAQERARKDAIENAKRPKD